METVKIWFKKLDPRATAPKYGTEFSAGADLYACLKEPVVVEPGETQFINTGLAMEIPEGCCGLIYARSGLACKKGLAPANKVGVIDSDYRGEIIVAIHNHGNMEQVIKSGDRIAQMVITPYFFGDFDEAAELEETVRSDGGFGSTGY
ncbi:MAG: dUTP diphosphatase [Eubacterium sp.]|nr:dUTP diphosphatase [Eubacterium sp.]